MIQYKNKINFSLNIEKSTFQFLTPMLSNLPLKFSVQIHKKYFTKKEKFKFNYFIHNTKG